MLHPLNKFAKADEYYYIIIYINYCVYIYIYSFTWKTKQKQYDDRCISMLVYLVWCTNPTNMGNPPISVSTDFQFLRRKHLNIPAEQKQFRFNILANLSILPAAENSVKIGSAVSKIGPDAPDKLTDFNFYLYTYIDIIQQTTSSCLQSNLIIYIIY